MTWFSTYGLSPADSFDLWREMTRGTYELAALKGEDRSLKMRAEMHVTPSLTLSEFHCQRNLKWRDRKHVVQDGRPYLKLRRYLSGSAVVTAGVDLFRLRPGSTYLLDQSRPFTELSGDNRQLNVFVPQDLIGFDPGAHESVIEWRDESPEGTIVLTALEKLWAGAFRAGNGDKAQIERDFCDVLRGAAADSLEIDAVRNGRLRAIEAEIGRLLDSRSGSVEDIVQSLPFSRAGLYRHFTGRGGISTHLRKRRLALAFHELTRDRRPHGAVYRVADRVGYSSIHSFSKAFKREFGFTPGEIAGTRTKISNAPESSITPGFVGVPGAEDFADAFRRIRAV